MKKEDIARALRENRRWRWRPGCLARSTRSTRWWRVGSEWGQSEAAEESTLYLLNRVESRGRGEIVVPDLDDPATVGILLSFLAEAERLGLTVQWPDTLDGPSLGLALVRTWRRADGFGATREPQAAAR